MQWAIESVAAIAAAQSMMPGTGAMAASQGMFPETGTAGVAQNAIPGTDAIGGAAQGAISGTGAIASAAQGTSAPDTFANLFQQQLSELNANVGAAETSMQDLAAGKSVELHDVMISLERARLSVQTFVQIRNKLVESYQDLMRMQL
jgi:flagellar hook-basal body complex protein FliE